MNKRSKTILDLAVEGVRDDSWKQELRQIEQRRGVLEAQIAADATADPGPPSLHPHMAALYRQKVRTLAKALHHKDASLRDAARDSLRGFLQAIMIPAEGLLQVRGDLGKMLTAAGGASHAAAVESMSCGGGI